MYVHLTYTQLSDKYSLSTVEKIIDRIRERAEEIKNPYQRKLLIEKIDNSWFIYRESDGYVIMVYYPDSFDGYTYTEYPIGHISTLLPK